ncbi:MAG: lysophospholipid acyltransferase family protein [Candidatus Omnitrophota bacterium]
MELKHIIRVWRRFIGYVMFRFCSLIICFIPAASIRHIAKALAGIGYILAGRHRKIALNSLEFAFAQSLNAKEKTKIAKDSFRHTVTSGLELIFCIEHPGYVKSLIKIEGKHNLDNALHKGKGVISVTAHFGNFPLMQLGLAQEGYRVNSIIRHMRDPQAERYFLKKRNQMNVKTIYNEPRNICIAESLRSLKNNEVLFILLDQNFGTGGVFVDFFNRKAATATGPIILAKRSKATIVPMFIVHNEDGTHRLIIEPEFVLEDKGTGEENISSNIQRLTDIIENYIRKFPSEWSWIHRRWKTQPKSK